MGACGDVSDVGGSVAVSQSVDHRDNQLDELPDSKVVSSDDLVVVTADKGTNCDVSDVGGVLPNVSLLVIKAIILTPRSCLLMIRLEYCVK